MGRLSSTMSILRALFVVFVVATYSVNSFDGVQLFEQLKAVRSADRVRTSAFEIHSFVHSLLHHKGSTTEDETTTNITIKTKAKKKTE